MSHFTARARIVTAIGVTAIALSFGGPVGAAASNQLVFTGALTGTLKIGADSGCDASANGVTLSSMEGHLSSKKFTTWAVTVYVAKLGTFTKFKFLKDSFVLGTSSDSGWVATSGSMTITASGGTVNLTLGAHEGLSTGTVHVKGAWSCPA